MKVLVTGAAGFIGKNFLLSLPRSSEVWATYRSPGDFEAFLGHYKLSHVKGRRLDLLDTAAVDVFLKEAGADFDLCVYFAANGDPALSVPKPAFDLECNALALVRLLERARFGNFVYFSSGAVYDGLQGEVGPNSPVNPTLPYAISKWAAEHYVKHFHHEKRLQKYRNVRFFGAYGSFEPPRKIYTKLVQRFAREKNPAFTIRGDGKNLIDAMYVDDAVRGIHALVAAPDAELTVDFGSQSPLSLKELVERAAATFGLKADIRLEGAVPEYIQFRSVDPYMRDRLGFVPKVPLEEGLRAFARFLETGYR